MGTVSATKAAMWCLYVEANSVVAMALAAKPYLEVGTRFRSGYRRAGGNGATVGGGTLGTGAGGGGNNTLGGGGEGAAGELITLGAGVAGRGYKPGDLGVGGNNGRRRENGVGGGRGKGGIGGMGGREDRGLVLVPRTRAGVISIGGGGGRVGGGGGAGVVAVARFKILAISKKALAVVDPNCREG